MITPRARDLVNFSATRKRRQWPTGMRWLFVGLLVAAALSGVLWGMVWWEEQPLRAVERLLEDSQNAQALELANRFLRDHSKHGPAIALKARALVRLGHAAEAAQLFDEVGAATEADMRDCARAYLMQERWVQALPISEYLVLQNPDDPDLLHELSACRAKLGRYDEALDAANRFAMISGFESRGQLLIGTLHQERGNNRKACDSWQKLLELNPEASNLQISSDEFFLQHGAALLSVGEPAAAIDKLSQSIKLNPTAGARSILGLAWLRLGKMDAAEKEWRLALELDPHQQAARQGLAELSMRKLDFRQAIDLLKPLADSPDISRESAFLLQRAYTIAGDTELASRWNAKVESIRKRDELQHSVDQVLLESPGTMWGQALRCYRLAEQGNWDQAEILLSPLMQNPSIHPFVIRLGAAIRKRSALPDLNQLPIALF